MNARKLTRRQMLGGLAGASTLAFNTSALSLIFKALIERQARADGITPAINRNLIFILHYGAPPRWGFDSFLNPDNVSSDIIDNLAVRNFLGTPASPRDVYANLKNEFASYQQTATPIEYKHQGQAKQIWLPRLWDATIPELSGGSATLGNLKMRDLLKNVTMIRGVHMLADLGHQEGPAFLARPNPTRPSLSGLVADRSTRRLAAVGLSSSLGQHIGFSSLNSGIFRALQGSENPLMDLLGPFTPESAASIASHAGNRAFLKNSFDSVLSQMEVVAKARYPGAEKFYSSLRNSKLLYEEGSSLFSNLAVEYAERLAKYKLIGDACRTHVGAAGLLPQFAADDSSVHRYAPGLAVAEFLIQKGLSSSITLASGGSFSVGKVMGATGSPELIRGGPDDFVQFDEHKMSCRQGSAIIYNLMFRVLMASLNEFARAIGDEFKDTLVVIGAEYGRNGRHDGKGSDHAVSATPVTLFSGMFDEFQPIGNIKKNVSDVQNSEHRGTWGLNAPTRVLSTQQDITITRSEIARTIADLMGVSSPVLGQSLLLSEAGKWRSKLEVPRNVA